MVIVKKKSVGKPLAIKLISGVYFLATFVLVILALLCFFGSAVLSNISPDVANQFSMLKSIGSGAFIFSGIMFLVMAIAGFFVGLGLFKLQNWARIVALVFACLGLISSASYIFRGDLMSIISLVINGAIGYYLYLNKKTVAVFKK